MSHRLDYASPALVRGIRMTTLKDGSVVIEVPSSRAEPFSIFIQVGVAVVSSLCTILGIVLLQGPEDSHAVGMILCFGLPAGIGFLLWSSVLPKPRRRSNIRLRAEWRGGELILEGPGAVEGPVRVAGSDIRDVRVDFDGGLEGTEPLMRLTLCRRDGAAMPLLPAQGPADLLWLADTLCRLIGVPTRPQRMATWFARKAAGFGPNPASPRQVLPVAPGVQDSATAPPLPAAFAPVLAYATPSTSRILGGTEFRPDGLTMWLPRQEPYAAYIAATVERFQFISRDDAMTIPCKRVYGFYVGAGTTLSPLTLHVCTLDGVHAFFGGIAPEVLRETVRLLNDLLGAGGSVYSL